MPEDLVDKINSCTSHIQSKEEVIKYAYTQTNFLDIIHKMAFSKEENHYKAIWILESIAIENPSLLLPYTDLFCKSVGKITNESAKRCLGKIGTIISINKDFNLSTNQQELLIECALDWLISENKVAVKCYSIDILDNFSTQHPYLIEIVYEIINKNYNCSSPAFKNKAKKFVKKYIQTDV